MPDLDRFFKRFLVVVFGDSLLQSMDWLAGGGDQRFF